MESAPPFHRQDVPAQVARLFSQGGCPASIRPYGQGNVNDTYLVSLEGVSPRHLILQRLNHRVFPRPELLMANLGTVTRHVAARLASLPSLDRRFELPRIVPAADGAEYVVDAFGCCWRALSFIDRTRAPVVVESPAHALEVGWALGRFHRLVSDLSPKRLADPLPGFHVTPGYLRQYDAVLARTRVPAGPEVGWALQFISRRRGLAPVLEEARARGELRDRVIHGDPKVDNVLLDEVTGAAVGLVDLDTVKPGLVHYDLGDCLRSGCNPLGEDPPHWQAVRFEPELAAAMLRGYLSEARGFLSPSDYPYLFPAARLIAFELGLRFFTDHLAGNVYFKVSHPEHNLARALVQFRLTESLETQEGVMRRLLRELA
jgi:Ser/Thr protein kinase RdoA (MazF antagonist)